MTDLTLEQTLLEFRADEAAIQRFFTVEGSANRSERLRRLYEGYLVDLEGRDSNELAVEGRVNRTLFWNHLRRQLRGLELDARKWSEVKSHLLFADSIIQLEEQRQAMMPLDPEQSASLVSEIHRQLMNAANQADRIPAHLLFRCQEWSKRLRATLEGWFRHYDGYDPMFGWWVRAPYQSALMSMDVWIQGLEARQGREIPGEPVGREALATDLAYEWIPYTPEELIEGATQEYAWCLERLLIAARELGFGDDWRGAQEHVKGLHEAPGKQPALVSSLAWEAIDFVESQDLVTVPPLAKETWRMEMMSPERQRVNPFFLGGESIIVSYPTDTMSHDAKRMSMRGNNRHFSRATVQHELIPGHHLQQFMTERHRPYRAIFSTPFWIEGWALHWEMLLWDRNFPRSPEDRIGMLFWRMHRCIRVLFSLGFHLGRFTTDECVRMLIDRVGHEPANAEGEVRRSFNGDYPPLYQAAYMVGAFQFRRLYGELVGQAGWTPKAFHDAVLHENEMPVAILREVLRGDPFLTPPLPWRFLD